MSSYEKIPSLREYVLTKKDKNTQELEKAGWIIPMKKTGEIHYSFNPRKAHEILQFYEKYCKK